MLGLKLIHVSKRGPWHQVTSTPLTNLPLDKMAAISQMIFSDTFSWMKSFVFWLKCHWQDPGGPHVGPMNLAIWETTATYSNYKARARFLSLARSKLRLCSAYHRAGYFSNLACDWLSIVWAYSEQETENGPWMNWGLSLCNSCKTMWDLSIWT